MNNNAKFAENLGIPLVDIATAKKLCRINIKCGYVPCLVGESGIGKTALCRQLAEEDGVGATFFYLAHQEREDIGGIPFPNGQKTAYKLLCEENIFALTKIEKEHYLVLDEWNRGPKEVMNAAFTLMEQRRFGSITLPQHINIIATMNPSEEEYMVNEAERDPAFRRRLAWIGVYTTPNVWLEWATKNDIDADIIKYISHAPAALYDMEAKKAGKIYANPAAWERVSKIKKSEKNINIVEFEYLIGGHIGTAQAAAFISWMVNREDYIDPEVIINSVDKIKNKIQEMANNPQKRGLLVTTIEGTALWISGLQAFPQHVGKNIGKFLALLPDEFQVLFLSVLTKQFTDKNATEKLAQLNQLLIASEEYQKVFKKVINLKSDIAEKLQLK